MNESARNIKKYRTGKGLSREEWAARFHVAQQAVSNWERGVFQR